jgi:hypothetical protein|tara:strand:+ start:4400 stop:6850 length:2451 start_codon:yes stop_codon:yes gene_type:complete
MGKVNIIGLGQVDIEGDTPNEQEIEVFKRMAAIKGAEKLENGPAEEATDNFLTSPKMGRILTEVGLSIAGSVATGGLALPGLALRAGMLARPFLVGLAKASAGSAAGGAAGAVVAQSFDPKEDIVKEILRAGAEGALGEAIGAPVVIKGGQVVSKLLSSKTPKQLSNLLKGAEDAENSLKYASNMILKADKVLLDPNASKEAVEQATKIFRGVVDPDERLKLVQSAEEISTGGLTPGIKTSNRTLEIIENIAQKSLIGGGAISRRYEAAGEIGNKIAKDVLDDFKVTADEAELGRLFFESIGGAKGAFNATKNTMYQKVDDILIQSGQKSARIIPVEDPFKKASAEIRELYSEGRMPDVLGDTLKVMDQNLLGRSGKYSFSELQKFRQKLVEDRFVLKGVDTDKRAVDLMLKEVDNLFETKVSGEAATALKEANQFFRSGQDIFNRGMVTRIIKNGSDGSIDGKDAKALQTVFKTIAGGDNVESTKALFREIDAMTGISQPGKGKVIKPLKGMIDPDTGKPLLTKKDAEFLKQSFRGQFITNALMASEDVGQFGSIYNAKKFATNLSKGEQKLRKELFQGDNAKALDDLINTLNFAQGDLSRISGLPGGIFIQMKQAGAAGSVLQMVSPAAVTGGQLGAAGLAASFLGAVPAITILAAPAIASRILLSPKFNKMMFEAPIDAIIKSTNMGKEEFLSLSTAQQKLILDKDIVQNKIKRRMNTIYRNIVGRMFTDGLITKEEKDQNLAKINGFEKGAEEIDTAKKSAALPNVQPSNFPIINTATSPMNTATGGGSNTELAQALNLFNKGGIVSAKKSF